MGAPLIAIVGRPNVGKSHLFNRLVGKRISIVEDTPGVTRDRIYAECEWAGRRFNLVDTGGIEPHTGDEMLLFMRSQADTAIDTADVVVLVCDLTVGVTAADKDVADMLLKAKKAVVLAVNKCDKPGAPDPQLFEFYNLGLGDPVAVSALQGYGTGDLLEACMNALDNMENVEDDDERINVAVIGKPNAGKSSLINKILGEKRVIVSPIAGTTRDAIDTPYECEEGRFNFIDTAGLRKQSKVDEQIEKFSVLRTHMAVERADVCLVMIDATEGVTEQDSKVAGLAHDAGKAVILCVNKWDAVADKSTKSPQEFEDKLRAELPFMDYAPAVFISALTGQRIPNLFPLIRQVHDNTSKRVTTGQLNQVLAEAVARLQPPSKKGRRLRIYYMTQTGVKPPHFVTFCNDATLMSFGYKRYLENRIREAYGFEGTPIRISVKQRGENAAPSID